MIGSVGDECQCLGSYNDFYDFRAWVVHHVAKGEMIEFTESGVSVYHWDRVSEQKFPNVLLTQECGQYLPMPNIDLQPRIGSSIDLVTELQEIEACRVLMPLEVLSTFLSPALSKLMNRS